MTILASICIVAGAILAVWNFTGVTDSFWSRKTRIFSAIGCLMGIGVFVLGIVLIMASWT